jgi:hypothetical protein
VQPPRARREAEDPARKADAQDPQDPAQDPARKADVPADAAHEADLAAELSRLIEEPLALEDRDDLDALVPRLARQGFVQIARKLRDEQRLDLLLPYATPEQLTGIFDLDAWRRERIDVRRAREWLDQIVECWGRADRPRGDLARLIYEMDPEMWTFATMAATAVAELDPEDDASRAVALDRMAALAVYETPDGAYVVGVPDNELGRAALRVLEGVYEDSLEDGRRLVASIKWGLASQIEDDLAHWREARLAELGFPPWDEAMRLFRPLSPHAEGDEVASRPVIEPDVTAPPVAWTGASLLRRVMARLSDAEHGIRTREFLLLVNELMAAQRLEPGDPELQARAIQQAQATVSLGMEVVASSTAHPDPEELVAGRMRVLGMRGLFRVGYGPLAKLRQAAQALHGTGRVSLESVGSLLDRPFGPALAALIGWYPELPLESRRGTRPLSSLADVARATALLAQGAALAALTFDTRGFAIDPRLVTTDVVCPEGVHLGDLIRTALVRGLLYPAESAQPQPLRPDELHRAATELLREGRLVHAAETAFAARCTAVGLDEHIEVLSTLLLTRLEVELGALEPGADGLPDPRKVGGLIV